MSTSSADRDANVVEPEVERFWESFYEAPTTRWSGRPNGSLVVEAADLAPGTALDLGCGTGADAIWLASRGWTATGVDISAAALDAASRAAVDAGCADAIAWERRDLSRSFPAGTFDLVAATYLHSPVELPWAEILRTAARAVAPGGTLLVIGHAPSPAMPHPVPSPEEVVDELALAADEWELLRCALADVEHAFPGEAPTTRTDAVVRLRRRR